MKTRTTKEPMQVNYKKNYARLPTQFARGKPRGTKTCCPASFYQSILECLEEICSHDRKIVIRDLYRKIDGKGNNVIHMLFKEIYPGIPLRFLLSPDMRHQAQKAARKHIKARKGKSTSVPHSYGYRQALLD